MGDIFPLGGIWKKCLCELREEMEEERALGSTWTLSQVHTVTAEVSEPRSPFRSFVLDQKLDFLISKWKSSNSYTDIKNNRELFLLSF